MTAGALTVVRADLATVTDLGRPRGSRFGVPVGGTLDQGSAQLANALVGNDFGEAVLETTATNLELVCDVDVLIATAGARMVLSVAGVKQPWARPVSVPAGSLVAMRAMRGGLRGYVAVRGSFDVPRLLGSCAPDTVLGFGGMLEEGSTVALRHSTAPLVNPRYEAPLIRLNRGPGAVPAPGSGLTATGLRGDPVAVDVVDGPDIAEFADTAARLFEGSYTVGEASNHIGLRLGGGPVPERSIAGEMLSRGVPVGAVEAPPGDELLVLHRGRGVTAGYPVLAVATTVSLDSLAQVRPGDAVRFRRVSVAQAQHAARAAHEHRVELRERVLCILDALGVRGSAPAGW